MFCVLRERGREKVKERERRVIQFDNIWKAECNVIINLSEQKNVCPTSTRNVQQTCSSHFYKDSEAKTYNGAHRAAKGNRVTSTGRWWDWNVMFWLSCNLALTKMSIRHFFFVRRAGRSMTYLHFAYQPNFRLCYSSKERVVFLTMIYWPTSACL